MNVRAIQLVNYLVYPLQFALLIPLLRIGAWMFGAQPVGLSIAQIVNLIRADVWNAIIALWTATLHALFAWLALGSLASLLLYFALTPILKKVHRTLP